MPVTCAWQLGTITGPHIPTSAPIPRPILEQFSRLRTGQALQIFYKSIDTTSRMIAELRMQIDKPEVIIRPQVEKFGLLDNVDAKELIDLGEAAAEAALPEIRQVLSWANQLSGYIRHNYAPGKIIEGDEGNHSSLNDL